MAIMKPNDKELADKIISQIQGFYDEVSVLSKSKPDNPLNPFKLKFINEKLTEANGVLTGDYKPLKDFTVSTMLRSPQIAMS
jgi:hypothetical protein